MNKKFGKVKEITLLSVFIALTSISLITLKNKVQAYELEQEIYENVALAEDDKLVDMDDIVEQNSITISEEEKATAVETKVKVQGNCVAVISIPSVNILGQVKLGTDQTTLKKYIGMFDSSVMPGENGNFCVAAHNNIYTELFRNLYKVKVGETVVVTTSTHEYTYKVESVNKIKPTQTEVLKQEKSKKEITLLTCTDMAKNRIVVKGTLVNEKETSD